MKYILNSFRQIVRGYLISRQKALTTALIIIVLILTAYFILLAPPANFPDSNLIRIHKGKSAGEITRQLSGERIVKWPWLLSGLFRLQGKTDKIIAGDYYFSGPENVLTIARRLTTGDFGIQPYKITIPEGGTVRTIAKLLDERLSFFHPDRFIELADSEEGYIFPDTYFFTSFDTEEDIIERMKKNFRRQTADLMIQAAETERSFSDIIIMASLLEKEAITFESKKIIAGILWKRIDEGMRLQVDAVFPYIIGKNTFQLTKVDLQIDSPYNTYRYAGLPPGPIANPGRKSIEAALSPEKSPFWFYLSDLKGEMHYAVTHDEHIINKRKYLK